ncbi:hypothetical protein Hdeb2414_s0235g00843101 [Helianthus debilis subsp. tardiflorus]
MIYSAVRKRDENGQNVDLEIKFNVGDIRRVLELGDSDDDPTIISERLCKGLWCRMGFTGHINRKMGKTMVCHSYKFLIHCVVHALSHRKGAYDETSDYIMNIFTCLVLNRPYNVSQVIFDCITGNAKAGSKKYIMYPCFIQMMVDDQFKDLEKGDDDVLGLRHMTAETISRLTKGPEPRVKRKICRINNPAYVALENDRWRHENSDSENEDEKMSVLVEKKTRWWFVRGGKRKRTPKTSPTVPIPKESTPKIVVKGIVKRGVICLRKSDNKENDEMVEKMKKLKEVNQTLVGMISDLHEATENELKIVKLEMEAMKADKVVKDEQLNMLYTVMESHLNIDVHAIFNNIGVKRVEERRLERERKLAEEATQRRKGLVVDTEETLGSSSQPKAGGSSSQVDIEMVDAEADPKGFILVGESSTSLNFDDIFRRVLVEQRRKKSKEQKVLLLKWKEEDKEEEEVEEETKLEDDLFEIGNYPVGDDDDDQGTSRLLIVNPNVQQRIEEFMNDEINEQEDDQHQEASTSGKQHVDQVFLTQPTVIFLHAQYEGELEVPRSRAEMLEELGLDDGKFKFDIEDGIPPSPEREYEFRYAQEADNYNDVIVEEALDSSDEETDFHYSGVDEAFPSLAEMFKDKNEDESGERF